MFLPYLLNPRNYVGFQYRLRGKLKKLITLLELFRHPPELILPRLFFQGGVLVVRSFLSGKMAAVLGGRKIGLKAKAFTPQVR